MIAHSVQPDILGRLLIIQQTLAAMPDDRRIAEFVCRALKSVPGVGEVLMCIRGRVIPEDARFQQACAHCDHARDAPATIDIAELEKTAGAIFFPMRTAEHAYGLLIVVPEDRVQLESYFAFLANTAAFIAMVLSNRVFQAELSDMNEGLRAARDDLEARVVERTRELEYSVTHDQLTGLVNRMTLVDRLQQAIASSGRNERQVAVVHLNLDNFKYVNDSLGSALGDEFLKEIAGRLQRTVRTNDTVARISGDKFVLLLRDQQSAAETAQTLAHILAAVREPVTLDGREIAVTGSIGCSFYPGDGDTAETLLKRASIAGYHAQDLGRDNAYFYTAGEDTVIADRAGLESDLRRALQRGELFLHYQPQLDLREEKYVGVEALMRWRHPTRGLVSPAQFIPIAEETGMIVSMGEWALRQACRQVQAWRSAGIDGVSVAVNLSAHQFRDKGIVDIVRDALRESGLAPALLELEITESSIMHGVEDVIALMSEFKALGVMLSIDDFGTGYSSLNYLRRFPVHKLKIDQSFVREVETIESAALVAHGVIGLGHTLGLKVIAEGVETVGQAEFLRDAGCDEIQGFLIARPQPAEELSGLLAQPPQLP